MRTKHTFPRRMLRAWLLLPAIWAGCSSCFDRSVPSRRGAEQPPPKAAPSAQPGDDADGEVIRRAAVAGSWYPSDKKQLQREVDRMLAAAPRAKLDGPVIALVSPHAGYRFSGKAAAAGFSLLRGQRVRRVIVLAVAHRVPFDGASIADVTHYETPLGLIPVDRAAVERLRRCPVVKTVAAAHQQEHSLEMQLPLLQRVVPGFSLVPLLISRMSDGDFEQLAAALADVVDPATVVVASSDFTHRGPNFSYEVPAGDGTVSQRVRKTDQGAVDKILALDRSGLIDYQKRTGATICGLRPIGTLLELLGKAKDVEGKVVAHYTSGDVTGDWSNTVTYVDVAFSGSWPEGSLARARSAGAATFPLADGDKRTLLRLARASLEASVKRGSFDPKVLPANVGSSLRRKAGAFVTLKCERGSDGRCSGPGDGLRGCIGTIPPLTPVYQTVAQRAASAALQDPRFRRVEPAELKHINVEVSVLTPPRRVDGPDAIVIGRHGIILSKEGHSATFLPQVAPEQHWDRDTTLSHLSRKAGLGSDGWRDGASFEVYEAIVFSERH